MLEITDTKEELNIAPLTEAAPMIEPTTEQEEEVNIENLMQELDEPKQVFTPTEDSDIETYLPTEEDKEEKAETEAQRKSRLDNTSDFFVRNFDGIACSLASNIGGEDKEEYETDPQDLKDLQTQVKNYIRTKPDFDIPPGMALLIIALSIYAPKMITAFGDRKKAIIQAQNKKAEQELNKEKQDNEL
jgi:hypothetical protein